MQDLFWRFDILASLLSVFFNVKVIKMRNWLIETRKYEGTLMRVLKAFSWNTRILNWIVKITDRQFVKTNPKCIFEIFGYFLFVILCFSWIYDDISQCFKLDLPYHRWIVEHSSCAFFPDSKCLIIRFFYNVWMVENRKGSCLLN